MSEVYGRPVMVMDLDAYLQKRGIYLDAGDINAAKTLLSFVADQQHGGTGKTFLIDTLIKYLTIGGLCTLDSFLKQNSIKLKSWQYSAATAFLKKQSDVGCTHADRMMIMDVLSGFINEHGNSFTL